MSLMPLTVTTKDIQRNYRKVFDLAKKTKQPIVVLTNNKPDVAIMGIAEYDHLQKYTEEYELQQALAAIADYQKAKKAGKLIKVNSVKDLLK